MLFERVFREYVENFKVALAFALLAVFVGVFSYFENISFSSGSMFLEYSRIADPFNATLVVAAFIVFTWFYSLLISAVILSVRRNLSKIKVEFYLSEMIRKFTVKIFILYLFLGLFSIAIGSYLTLYGYEILLANTLFLLIGMLLIFVPQAIVVEELGLWHAILENLAFIRKNFKRFFLVLFAGAIILLIIGIIEYALDVVALEMFAGRFVSLILVLVFAVPFIETLKTYLYMLKFNLIKGFESLEHEPKEKTKSRGLQNI